MLKNFNFASKSPKWGFLAQNFVLLEKNCDRLNFRESNCPLSLCYDAHEATDCGATEGFRRSSLLQQLQLQTAIV